MSIVETAVHTSRLAFARQTLIGAVKHVVTSRSGVLTLVVLVDVLALSCAFVAFYAIRVNPIVIHDPMEFPVVAVTQTTALVVLFWELLFWFSGAYINAHNRSLFDEFLGVMKIVVVGFAVLLVALTLEASGEESDAASFRLVSMSIYFALTATALGIGRWNVRFVVRGLRRRGIGLKRTIIVGDSPRSRQLIRTFDADPALGYAVIGTITTGDDSAEFTRRSVGTIDDLDHVIASRRVEVTVLGLEQRRELVPKLMTETAVADTTIKIIPDLYDMVSGQARATHLYGIPLIEINPRIMPVWEEHLKRVMDIAIAAMAIVVGMPIWLIIALAIKAGDGGPVFYSQERVGLNGRTYMMHKFRSMRVDAESKGISWTSANDPRVTRVGRFIRKTHIDEAPQLINVLKGEMSLVGPRPERPFYVEKYSRVLPSYPRRLRVKPGLTGWNQVHMEDMAENVEFIQERLRHDFFYIENLSLRLDMEIIFRTLLRVLQRKGQA